MSDNEEAPMIGLRAHQRDLLAGMRAMAPWLIGLAPFGLVIGVSAAEADIPTLAGWLTGPTIYAGSAQVATIQMLDAGAAAYAVIITALVINIRLILYSAAMATYWRGTPLWWRLVGGYLLIDPSFVVGVERYADEPDRRRGHAHYLGGAVVLWVTWLAALAVGATAGAQLPDWLQLEFLIPLFLIGEVVPKLRQVATRRAVLVAAVVALVCLGVPMHLGIAIGIVAGIAVGVIRPGAGQRIDNLEAMSIEETQR
jgi:predicted branched-subunit amino acid permease